MGENDNCQYLCGFAGMNGCEPALCKEKKIFSFLNIFMVFRGALCYTFICGF